jgi:DNA-directed RNA polymerase specialized sigma24 family protein
VLVGSPAVEPDGGEHATVGFDPADPRAYDELCARSRYMARKVGLDETLGDDALNEKLVQMLDGDERLRQGQGYILRAVLHQLQDWARRRRRSQSLDAAAREEDGRAEPSRSEVRLSHLVRQAWGDPPTIEDRLLLEEEALWHEARAALLQPALERVSSARFRAALKAQWKGALLRAGGREAVTEFESRFGLDLGPAAGTSGLAALTGLPEGTVSSDAHRGRAELRRHLRALEEVQGGGSRPCKDAPQRSSL